MGAISRACPRPGGLLPCASAHDGQPDALRLGLPELETLPNKKADRPGERHTSLQTGYTVKFNY
jgi:hypothetical protein